MKILVPTDLSPCSEAAVDLAVQMARLSEGEVVLHHIFETAIDWVKLPSEEESNYPELKSKIGSARYYMHQLEKKYEGVCIQSHLSFNETVEEMIEDARLESVDWIVAGTHGNKDLSNMILGSDAQRIIRLASCPVMILKNRIRQFPFKSLLFVSDFNENIADQFDQLVEIADLMKARVHLGYVNTPISFKNSKEIENRMEHLSLRFPDHTFTQQIYNHVHTDQGIFELAQKTRADALALITHFRSGWSRLFHSSLTEKIALESEIPVISFHKRD